MRRPGQAIPKAWETLFAANFIFERSIIREKLRTSQPDLYIDAGHQPLPDPRLPEDRRDSRRRGSRPRRRVKAQLARLIEAETLPARRARRGSAAAQCLAAAPASPDPQASPPREGLAQCRPTSMAAAGRGLMVEFEAHARGNGLHIDRCVRVVEPLVIEQQVAAIGHVEAHVVVLDAEHEPWRAQVLDAGANDPSVQPIHSSSTEG